MSLARLSVEITYTNDTKVTYNDVEECETWLGMNKSTVAGSVILDRVNKHDYIELEGIREIKLVIDEEGTR